jgi:hypothetical protein
MNCTCLCALTATSRRDAGCALRLAGAWWQYMAMVQVPLQPSPPFKLHPGVPSPVAPHVTHSWTQYAAMNGETHAWSVVQLTGLSLQLHVCFVHCCRGLTFKDLPLLWTAGSMRCIVLRLPWLSSECIEVHRKVVASLILSSRMALHLLPGEPAHCSCHTSAVHKVCVTLPEHIAVAVGRPCPGDSHCSGVVC